MTITDLLTALAAQTPPLHGAACRGKTELYDRTVTMTAGPVNMRRARAEALAVCQSCPALTDCRHWLEALPEDQRPRGVVAGTIIALYPYPTEHRPHQLRSHPQLQAAVQRCANGYTTRAAAAELGCSTFVVWRAMQNPTTSASPKGHQP